MKHLTALIGLFLCSSGSFATAGPPAAPTNLTATAVSTNQINLSWTDNSKNETGFKIERSRDGITFAQKYVVGVNVTAYTDSMRQASTKHYYRVRAYDSGGNSGYSNTANATTATTLAQLQFYIAIRTDGFPGSGTQADPYDGSTPAKFDAIMSKLQAVPSPAIHLVGRGPFRTYATHKWFVHSGWVISGDGMYSTRMQMAGSVAGIHGTNCISSDPTISSDYTTIQDLTIDCNWAELSQTADTGAGGEKNIVTNAIVIWGSNNLIERVRAINGYGSFANQKEMFLIALIGPRTGDGTNNVIQFCRAEQPWGTCGCPFALAGWLNSLPYYVITNSKVVSCTGVGVNNGLINGFNSGGVNVANVKDCVVDSNTFIDCYGAAYTDTGSIDGLQVTNNTVIRGWCGIGFRTHDLPKQNIQVSGNNISIQNRDPNGAVVAMSVDAATTTNLTINNNIITFDTSGGGLLQFWGLVADPLNTATISNNTIQVPINTTDYARGVGVTLFNNLQPNGAPVPGL